MKTFIEIIQFLSIFAVCGSFMIAWQVSMIYCMKIAKEFIQSQNSTTTAKIIGYSVGLALYAVIGYVCIALSWGFVHLVL